MNIKTIALALSACVALGASAQEAAAPQGYDYTFNRHFYIQAQGGVQETLGEGSFGHLLSPNVQLGVGYKWSPIFGTRIAVNAWQSKATMKMFDNRYDWKWNYVSPTLDLTFDVTNAVWGFNPERKISFNLLAGVGVNVGFKNDEAIDVASTLYSKYNKTNNLANLWDGTKARFVGQFGFAVDYNITKNWAVGLEMNANVLNDNYNSKRAKNADWYFNGLLGVKYTFGDSYKKTPKVVPCVQVPAEPVIVEKIVEKVVERPVEVARQIRQGGIQRDIFFTIDTWNISLIEQAKVREIAHFMEAHPQSKVAIRGYADKGTGTVARNLLLSKERADAVAKMLTDIYHISPDRITTSSMGEAMEQPYGEPILNRVAICVVENPE